MNKKQICRRIFLKNTAGYFFLTAVIVAPGWISLKNYKNKKNGQMNASINPCQQCSLLSECDLPEATLFRETAASTQSNPFIE